MATKKNTGTTMTKTEPQGSQLALDFDALAQDAGAGTEGADRASFAIPFIQALQGLSPQLERVDGAKPGMLINTITEAVSKELRVIPCAFQRRYVRWAPRDEGGGYKGDLSPLDVEGGKLHGATRDPESGHWSLEGDELKDTRNHYVLVETEDGTWQPALLSLTSTQIKKSKRWMSRIQGLEMRTSAGKPFTPPSYSHIYRITTVKEENSKGAWWGLVIDMDGPVQDAGLYAKAKAFSQSVTAGEIEVSAPENDEAHSGF